jgi:hypothetical protein
LIGFSWTKNARRIFAIVSTTSIPTPAPMSLMEANPGVPIGCRSPRRRGPYSMPIHIQHNRRVLHVHGRCISGEHKTIAWVDVCRPTFAASMRQMVDLLKGGFILTPHDFEQLFGRSNPSPRSVVIGKAEVSGAPVSIGDIERRAGLYILGQVPARPNL